MHDKHHQQLKQHDEQHSQQKELSNLLSYNRDKYLSIDIIKAQNEHLRVEDIRFQKKKLQGHEETDFLKDTALPE
eukprot:CAMPEP_0116892226 /NCGR_PEP_ID=MMETSP0467-20121206/2492_1 /TAXON_ID=283647 /ORGANISM="Mesodinium pulex, Strain SPMC105" /LENGTH=74 /DNA_ID=CAMNT_0004561229 /DNA_START=422 /DNA_END=646 /DNA_ORIENTATION=+